MVLGHISNVLNYIPRYKDEVAVFLKKATFEIADGEYPIIGKEIFARVQSYPLRTPERGRVEAHNSYIDIQSVIAGTEGIDIFRRDLLTLETAYDDENDVEFYNTGPKIASLELPEGYFAMLFPNEAHRPQMFALGAEHVKKFVIKYGVHLCE
ncbi:MAG: YhcH/YjgK/YiaL family protein [Clostridiales bacterium]|jgi:YhcH/YjgK/YiaL family protein|nr:YhcH/YjgK/YiaL family protein [Clostridiales bacterium]